MVRRYGQLFHVGQFQFDFYDRFLRGICWSRGIFPNLDRWFDICCVVLRADPVFLGSSSLFTQTKSRVSFVLCLDASELRRSIFSTLILSFSKPPLCLVCFCTQIVIFLIQIIVWICIFYFHVYS